MKTVFLRMIEADDKAESLRMAIDAQRSPTGNQRFEVSTRSFATIPGTPFAYWASNELLDLFAQLPPFEVSGRTAKQGLATSNDPRYLRLAWEVFQRKGWYPYAKGGEFSRFYSDIHLLVNWGDDGEQIKAEVDQKYSHIAGYQTFWVVKNPTHYFRSGVTWPRRTQGGLSVRSMPAGCIFADKGPAAFIDADNDVSLLALLAIVNSSAFRALVDLQMAFGSYEVGVIRRTPVPDINAGQQQALASRARNAWSIKRQLDARSETSRAFVLPAILKMTGASFSDRTTKYNETISADRDKLTSLQLEIDDLCFDAYGIGEPERESITQGFVTIASELGVAGMEGAPSDDDGDLLTDGEKDVAVDSQILAAELLSWAIGTSFGRFDIRLATGERVARSSPDPFEVLPACSPGMLTDETGTPAAGMPPKYPVAFPANGILVDDPGSGNDLIAALHVIFDQVFKEDANRWWNEIGSVLSPKDGALDSWVRSNFFMDHLKRYSKSRRKAPIIWQIGVPSGRFSVWLYAHRLTRDSLFQIQRDVLTPKIAHEQRQLTSMLQDFGANPAARERKLVAEQEAFIEELRALLREVQHVAPLWNPSLEDGVVLTKALLWRLIPQHKSWQRELKKQWEELASGKYDWANIAMQLWPERVIPKCATDRSLAIAHRLEDIFWIQANDGKWEAREAPKRPIEELVRERTSAAVKAALKELSEAPAANAPKKVRRSV